MPYNRVSPRQLKLLLDFMEQHRDLALGRVRGKEGNVLAQRLWKKCSIILNAVSDGCDKPPPGWQKYFNQYKSRVKLKFHTFKHGPKGADGKLHRIPFTPLEKKLYAILGGSSTSPLPVRQKVVFTYGSDNDGEENEIDWKSKEDLDEDIDSRNPLELNDRIGEDEQTQEQTEESDTNAQTEYTERPAKRCRRNDPSHSPTANNGFEEAGQRLASIELARLEVDKEQVYATNRQADATNRQAAALELLVAQITRAVDIYAATARGSNTSSGIRSYKDELLE